MNDPNQDKSQFSSQLSDDQRYLASQELRKKVGLRTELMEKLLGHVVREEKYQTACLRPIDTSPNREKLLAQCRAQK